VTYQPLQSEDASLKVAGASEILVSVPLQLSAQMIDALRRDPRTSVEDKETWYVRLGWLTCAWDVLLDAAKHERQCAEWTDAARAATQEPRHAG
jgi:hypothetical protein